MIRTGMHIPRCFPRTAQRPAVQPPAGSTAFIDQYSVFSASGCENRPDPAGRLRTLVGPPAPLALSLGNILQIIEEILLNKGLFNYMCKRILTAFGDMPPMVPHAHAGSFGFAHPLSPARTCTRAPWRR